MIFRRILLTFFEAGQPHFILQICSHDELKNIANILHDSLDYLNKMAYISILSANMSSHDVYRRVKKEAGS